MELILWRHAQAEVGDPDLERPLTQKGRKQAHKMAAWLDSSLPNSCRILCSPAVRSLQTVEPLKRKFRIIPELGPNCSVEQFIVAVNWPNSRDPVLVIGHQPTLGAVAATLLTGISLPWTLRKGNVLWLVHRETPEKDEESIFIKAVLSPELLLK